jgi:hypothetical protein
MLDWHAHASLLGGRIQELNGTCIIHIHSYNPTFLILLLLGHSRIQSASCGDAGRVRSAASLPQVGHHAGPPASC